MNMKTIRQLAKTYKVRSPVGSYRIIVFKFTFAGMSEKPTSPARETSELMFRGAAPPFLGFEQLEYWALMEQVRARQAQLQQLKPPQHRP